MPLNIQRISIFSFLILSRPLDVDSEMMTSGITYTILTMKSITKSCFLFPNLATNWEVSLHSKTGKAYFPITIDKTCQTFKISFEWVKF